MAYQALARTYRPQAFGEVIGQDHVTRTLKNAIESGKVAQAYLFSGPRGVGKTTTARILAKALNCEKGPTANPCNKCNSCVEITGNSSLDVQEIDGASNRGIDDIRALRENVKFMPASARHKVYIIDEVHQITKDAFNALLKTLEEPPEHVVFIMATTEPEKMLATILSRCQRFSFKLVTHRDIYEHLKRIALQEKVKLTDDAFNLIAACGQGSIRDAMSILDQVVSFAGKKEVKKEDVVYILGIIPEEELAGFSDLVSANKIKEALKSIDGMVEKGYDVHQFVSDLRNHFRNMLVVKAVGNDPELLAMSEDSRKALAERAGKFRSDNLLRIIDELSRMHEKMKWSEQPRAILEVGVFRLCQPWVSIEEIIEKIAGLEGNPGTAAEDDDEEDDDDSNPGQVHESGVKAGQEPAKPAGPDKSAEQDKPAEPVEPVQKQEPVEPVQKQEQAAPAGGEPAAEKKVEKKEPGDIQSEGYKGNNKWEKFLDTVRVKSPMIYNSLKKGYFNRIEDDYLYITFHNKNKFNKGAVERKKEILKEMVKEAFGKYLGIRLDLTDNVPERGVETIPDPEEFEEEDDLMTDDLYKDIKKTDPVVSKVLHVFRGSKIIKVRKKKQKD